MTPAPEGTEQAPSFSVVIPAHNEESVIARCLAALTVDAKPGEIEIVVVCNGCVDDTVQVARRSLPTAAVIDLPTPGKAGALNEGDRHATVFPRIYVDADIEVSVASLREVADLLRQGAVHCAAPRPHFVVEGRPWMIRSFYRVWQMLPYLNDEPVGSGVYAMSEAGRQRFAAFPDLTADDQFVMQQFDRSERRCVRSVVFNVHTPRRLSGLVQMRRRVYRGNRELAGSDLATHEATGGRAGGLGRLARQPQLVPAVATYVAINVVALAGARLGRHKGGWERDESARQAPAALRQPLRSTTVGYLVSRYPSISHTFVLREVLAGRDAGLDIATFSVRRANPSDLLADVDRQEAARTWSLRPVSLGGVMGAQWRALRRSPLGWLRTLRVAIRNAPPGLRAQIWQVLYFVQAMMLWGECDRRHIAHLHAHLANVASDVAWLASDFGRRVEPDAGWGWSMSIHGPTEFFDVARSNLVAKVGDAELVLCISDFAKSQLMAVSPPSEWHKLVVVHMGADLHRYSDAIARTEPPAGSTVRILSVGRLDPVKGQTVLLEAVALLREAGVDVHLTLVGDGPAAEEVRRAIDRLEISGLVTLPGAVGQDTLPDYYASADIFCLASFAEGVPVVLMEAMACGLPVISTRIAGIPELIEDGRSGLLIPPGRADLLADALARLAKSPALRHELGAEGRATVVRDFDAELCGRQAAAHLASLVGVTLPAN